MTTVDDIIGEGLSLADEQRFREAIDALTRANRDHPDSAIEKALVRLRHDALVKAPLPPVDGEWPPAFPDVFAGIDGLPEVDAADLTAEVLGAAIVHHGSLLVRGLVPTATTSAITDEIDHVFDGYDAYAASDDDEEQLPWYSPFPADEPYTWTAFERLWARKLGGVMAPDSPRALATVLDALQEAGLGPLLEDYLGQWPALSVKKFTLRRTPPDAPSEWHQDGSFLGQGIRTVNVWLALSDCGVDAPGLDIVPQRFDRIVDAGTDDSLFDWSVSRRVADEVSGGRTVTPVFGPGDAVLFDQLTLHRTHVTPAMTKVRYAIESWFFAPSTYPDEKIPLAF